MSLLNRLEALIHEHAAWSQKTFGLDSKRGPKGPLIHLKKEVREAIDKPKDIMEHADIFLLSLDALRRAGFTFTQLVNAARDKLEINKARDWPALAEQPVDGLVEHVAPIQTGDLTMSPVMESPDKVATDLGLQATRPITTTEPVRFYYGDAGPSYFAELKPEQVRLLVQAASELVAKHLSHEAVPAGYVKAVASALEPFKDLPK